MTSRARRPHGDDSQWDVRVNLDGSVQQEVRRDQLPGAEAFEQEGQHLWVVLTAHRVDPAVIVAGEDVHLDNENLMDISAPACFLCATFYTPEQEHTVCPGWRDA